MSDDEDMMANISKVVEVFIEQYGIPPNVVSVTMPVYQELEAMANCPISRLSNIKMLMGMELRIMPGVTKAVVVLHEPFSPMT